MFAEGQIASDGEVVGQSNDDPRPGETPENDRCAKGLEVDDGDDRILIVSYGDVLGRRDAAED